PFALFQSRLSHAHYSYFLLTFPSTTEIYTLSLHDALPILDEKQTNKFYNQEGYFIMAEKTIMLCCAAGMSTSLLVSKMQKAAERDRKSTRLNSSHVSISYAVFCLKKKKH